MTQNNTGILGLIRARRRLLTSGLITLLVGGWISALCQQCFANSNNYPYPDTEFSHSRDHCLPDNTRQNNSTEYGHCQVDCDCNTAIAVSDNHQKSLIAVVKNSFNENQFSVVSTDNHFVINIEGDPDIFLYKNPELPRLLPLERFPVLLI